MIGPSASHRGEPPASVRSTLDPRTRLILLVTGAVGAMYPVVEFLKAAANPNINGYGGIDFTLYMDATRRWLGGGSFYHPYQLAGPYEIQHGDVLYQPNSLILFVPFTVLPAILWWVIPLGTTVWAMVKLRPSIIAWPFIAFCLAWPPTLARTVAGNPVMWAVAAVALGCLYRWPAVGVLIKPSLFPFALIGIRDRRWWMALALGILTAVPFGAMWFDWIRTVTNSQGGGLAYSFQDIPLLLIPILAWKLR